MRTRIDSTRPAVTSRTGRRQVAPASRGAAACFLTLPNIDKSIPVKSVWDEDEKWLKAAELCASLVGDDELNINDKTTARDIIVEALSIWASRHCADISVLDNFELQAALNAEDIEMDYESAKSAETECLYIGFRSCQMTPMISVKKKLEELDAAHPGLAGTAFAYAERAGYRTFTPFSPHVAFHQATYLYWQGCDNDDDLNEEMEAQGMEEEERDGGGLLPSTFFDAYPEYLTKSDPLERDVVERIALRSDEAGETAKVILSIMDLIELDASMPYYESGNTVYFSCYIEDGENNQTSRILDDIYEQSQYGGECTDLYGVSEIPLEPLAFQKWKTEMEQGFSLYTHMDRLMRCIGEVQ